jgi:hypothetical protein
MKWCVAVFIIAFYACSNSSKVENNGTVTDSSVIVGYKPTSYAITGFMGFNKTTTFDSVEKFLNSRKTFFKVSRHMIDFYETRGKMPGISFIAEDCPFANFIFVPTYTLENLNLKNILFTFQNNTLALVCISELRRDLASEVFKLKEYYYQKYGEGEYKRDTLNKNFIVDAWQYKNYQDSITVRIARSKNIYEYQGNSEIFFDDEITIFFPNTLFDCTHQHHLEQERIKKEKDSLRDKNITDKL